MPSQLEFNEGENLVMLSNDDSGSYSDGLEVPFAKFSFRLDIVDFLDGGLEGKSNASIE